MQYSHSCPDGACSSQPYSRLEAAVNGATPAYSPGWAYEIMNPGAYAAIGSTPQAMHAYTTQAATVTTLEKPAIYESQPVAFLSPERPVTPFIAEAGLIAGLVREAFLATTQHPLPADIMVTVAQRRLLQQIHGQFLNSSVVGLSLNATREIFAVSGSLDELMLVIGHELGHVLSPALGDPHAEEAKAFAFESAWANAIFTRDIGGLRMNINAAALSMMPAQNGLHDLAFAFVKAAALSGKEPLELHSELSERRLEFSDNFEATPSQQAAYTPLAGSSTPAYRSGGYRNVSNVQNVPWLNNFSWADLGTGIYGMYIPSTASIFMNEKLLRNDLEQFHKTLGHEYVLHHVMHMPDGYAAKVMEDAIFWIKEDKDNPDQAALKSQSKAY